MKVQRIKVEITPPMQLRGDFKTVRIEVELDRQPKMSLFKSYPESDFESVFDRMWYELGRTIKEEALDGG